MSISHESVSPERQDGLAPFLPPATDFLLAREAALTLGALPEEIPDYDEVMLTMPDATRNFLAAQGQEGSLSAVTIHIPVTPERPLKTLTTRFEAAAREKFRTWCGVVYSNSEWHSQDPTAHNKARDGVEITFALRDQYDVFNRKSPTVAPGLMFTDMDAEGQRGKFNEDQARCQEAGVDMQLLTPQELLVLTMKQILAGTLRPERRPRARRYAMMMRCLQYAEFSTAALQDGGIVVGFGGAPTDKKDKYMGVRRVVRPFGPL